MRDEVAQMICMEHHSTQQIDGYIDILRVPGGWIYRFYGDKDAPWTSVFVPIPPIQYTQVPYEPREEPL